MRCISAPTLLLSESAPYTNIIFTEVRLLQQAACRHLPWPYQTLVQSSWKWMT